MPKKRYPRYSDSEDSGSPKKQKVISAGTAGVSPKEQEIGLKMDNITPRKQKAFSEPLPQGIQDIEEKIERELEIKAERNNLTARNVKNMIKAVITDTEVLKMVDFSLQKSEEKPTYELKLTRAKTKELVGLEQNVIFNTPAQKNSEMEALIAQELPEDSSDEEYEPHFESEDDEETRVSESGVLDDDADLDISIKSISSQDSYIRNGNIGQRTRSKLCLSETPLETIEQAFIPPDITTDMYNTDCDNEDWLDFLKEFTQPLDPNNQENNDDENDPEYNVMLDEEREAADKEELRADRAVKVTKKELNDLMTELFEYTQMLSSDDEEVHPKVQTENKIVENEEQSTENQINTGSNPITQLSFLQSTILKQQLQQHVQLVTQTCLLLCGLPNEGEYNSYYLECKTRLEELNVFKKMYSQDSYFNILNLESSIKLINDWTDIATNSQDSEKITNFLLEQQNTFIQHVKKKERHRPKLPAELIKLCLKSDAFLYPLLLPSAGFSMHVSKIKLFSEPELRLIAIGLEEFSEFLGYNLHNFAELKETVSYVHHYLVPAKDEHQILKKVQCLIASKTNNPVKEFYFTNNPVLFEHYIFSHTSLKVLSEYSEEFFHDSWQEYLYNNT